jgi:hypothetical protein
MSEAETLQSAVIIPFPPPRRPAVVVQPRDDEDSRHQAVERLRASLPPGSLLYVTRHWYRPENEWLVCDFFRIDGHFVDCVTADVALAIDRYDPEREVGVKLHRPRGADPLTALIDGTLSRVLHGEPGAVQHVIID